MPRNIDPIAQGEVVREAASRVIVAGGLPALTLRAVAAEAGLSPASLSHQFTNRRRFLNTTCARLGHQRVRTISNRSWREGALAFLPADDAIPDARVWLAWEELGRSDREIGNIVAHLRAEERELLSVILRRSLAEPALDVLMAVIDGLLSAVCAGAEPMPLDRARAALVRVLPPDHVPDTPPPDTQPGPDGLRSAS